MKFLAAFSALLAVAAAVPRMEDTQTSLATEEALGLKSGILIYGICKPMRKAGLSEKSYVKCKEGCKKAAQNLKKILELGCSGICDVIPGSATFNCKGICEACKKSPPKDKDVPSEEQIDKDDAKNGGK